MQFPSGKKNSCLSNIADFVFSLTSKKVLASISFPFASVGVKVTSRSNQRKSGNTVGNLL